MALNKFSTFARTILGSFETAFPFEHCPAVIAVLRHLREDATEIHLTVAKRAEPAGPRQPWLIARIDSLPPSGVELRVLHMKRFNSFMVDVDERQIVELLQNKVRWIIVDANSFMAADGVDKHFERRSIKKILPRVDLIAQVATDLVISVKDWFPTLHKFSKSCLDKAGR